MRTTLKLIFLIFIFGCKNQPNNKIAFLPEIKKTEKQSTETIFDLIMNKKESPKNFPDSIAYKFDFSKRFTKKEISVLNLDTAKIDLSEYYFLTNQKFLKKSLDSISFFIYYKHRYGDQLEKVLRVKKQNSNFDLILAMEGGDSFSHNISTEFINDSVFIKTYRNKQTAVDNTHLMAYATDSIITEYKYNKRFEFKKIKKDSFHIYKEYPIYHKKLKDSVFKTWSEVFTINKIKCRWEYEVIYTDETNENSKELFVNLISQRLIDWKTKELLLDLDLSKFLHISPKDISKLEYNKPFYYTNDRTKDINFDGYDDFEFHDNVGGANQYYTVYLFNPNLKKFEYSKELSGNSLGEGIELNKEKRKAIYSGKGGGGIYSLKNVYFNLDGNIKHLKIFWNEEIGDYNSEGIKYSFNYKKEKNGIVIDSLKVIRKIKIEGLESIYNPFFEWVNSIEE